MMRIIYRLATILLFGSISCLITKGISNAAIISRNDTADSNSIKVSLDEVMNKFIMEYKSIPSILLLIETPDFIWKGSAGFSDPVKRIKAESDDLFYIASAAKPMTAAIVLKLFEDKRLNLDDKVSMYLSKFFLDNLHVIDNQDYSDSITIRQLLNHTSGLGDNWSDNGFMMSILTDKSKFWNPVETIEFVKENVPPLSVPGKEWHYSDINYNLLGLIIEKITNKKLPAVYREYMLNPLDMRNTYRPFYENPDSLNINSTKSVSLYGDIDYSSFRSMTADWAGGGLVSSTEDLNKFIRALFKGKIFRDQKTLEMMREYIGINQTMSYGLGLAIDNLNSEGTEGLTGYLIGHTGASGAFMFYWKEKDISICGTINQAEDESKIGELISKILRILKTYY